MYYRHLQVVSTEIWSHDPWPGLSDHLPILSVFEIA